jgi:hypothetical protein
LDVETNRSQRVLVSHSDVLAQAVNAEGTLLLCGHRNGTISQVDPRCPLRGGATPPSAETSAETSWTHTRRQKHNPTQAAVCGVELMPGCEHYAIVSHINGRQLS